jgi:ABC-2 type transport system permease protein/oleandomycin transport system permease protein
MTTTTTTAPASAPRPAPTGTAPAPHLVPDTMVIAKRHLIALSRQPQLLVFVVVQPIMFVLLFRFVFGGGMRTPPGYTYVDYLLPGIITQTIAFGATNTAVAMAVDLDKGIIDRFRALPMSRSAVIGGRVLADLARLLLTMSVMTVVGLLIGWRPDLNPLRLLAALLFALGFGQAMSWLSALVGLSVKSVEAAQAASFVGIFPLTFASSVFVPVEFMPGWLQAFARANPITLVASTIRFLTHGDPLGQTWWQALLWLVTITAAASWAATRRYKRVAS